MNILTDLMVLYQVSHIRKIALQIRQTALQTRKKATQIRKRALQIKPKLDKQQIE